MEFLGHTTSKFKKNTKTNKWDALNVMFEDSESYCEATSKLINGFKDECRFVVADEIGDRYFVDVLEYRYDAPNNTIKLFPEDCRMIKK
jgi:hypothetical protein